MIWGLHKLYRSGESVPRYFILSYGAIQLHTIVQILFLPPFLLTDSSEASKLTSSTEEDKFDSELKETRNKGEDVS